VNDKGWVAAWFPGEETDGKLFTFDGHPDSVRYVTSFMYARRLLKQVKLPLGIHHATVPDNRR
jgi:hypothetical protein